MPAVRNLQGESSPNRDNYPAFTRLGSSDPQSKKSRTISCERCKRRKQRCDHRLPTCTSCLKANATCIQPEKYQTKIPEKDDYTLYLEQKIESLERSLASVTKDNNYPKQSPNGSNPRPHTDSLPTSQKSSEAYHNGAKVSPAYSTSSSSPKRKLPFNISHSKSNYPKLIPDEPSDDGNSSLDNGKDTMNDNSPYSRDMPTSITSPSLMDSKSSNLTEPSTEADTTQANRTVSILNLDPDVEAPQSFSVVSSMLEESIWDRTVQRDKSPCAEGSGEICEEGLNNLLVDFTFESLIAKYDAVEPPKAQLAKRLVDGYLIRLHHQIPVLARSDIKQIFETRDEVPENTNDSAYRLKSFRLYMIYAIMGTISNMAGHYDGPGALGLYATAVRHGKMCETDDPMLQVEALILCAFFQTRVNIDDGRHWFLIDRAMEICVREEMHLEESYEKYDLYTQQLRKRLFWSLYSFERLLSITTNRPYRLLEKEITVHLPLDIDDFITDENLIREAMVKKEGSEEPPKRTNLTHYVRMIELKRLESEIVENVCRVNKSLESRFPEVQPFLERIKKWEGISQSADEFEYNNAKINYTKSVRILIQPFLGRIDPRGQLFQECMNACGDLCFIYKNFHRRTLHGFTTPSIHAIFMAGLTLVYGLWLSRDFWPIDLMGYLRDCSCCLYVMAERSSTGRGYRETFERLLSGTLQYLKDNGAFGQLPQPSLHSPYQIYQPHDQSGSDSASVFGAKSPMSPIITSKESGKAPNQAISHSKIDASKNVKQPRTDTIVTEDKSKRQKLSDIDIESEEAQKHDTPEQKTTHETNGNLHQIKIEHGQTELDENIFDANYRMPHYTRDMHIRAYNSLSKSSQYPAHHNSSYQQYLNKLNIKRRNNLPSEHVKPPAPLIDQASWCESQNKFLLPPESVSTTTANDIVTVPESTGFDKKVVSSLDNQNGLLKGSWGDICQYDDSMYSMIQDISVWTKRQNSHHGNNGNNEKIGRPKGDNIRSFNNHSTTEPGNEDAVVDLKTPRKVSTPSAELNTPVDTIITIETQAAINDDINTSQNTSSYALSSLFNFKPQGNNMNEMGLFMDDYPWDTFNDYGFFN